MLRGGGAAARAVMRGGMQSCLSADYLQQKIADFAESPGLCIRFLVLLLQQKLCLAASGRRRVHVRAAGNSRLAVRHLESVP